MNDIHRLREMLYRELCEFGRKSEITMSSLPTIDTLAHACKNVGKIIEMWDENA